MYVTEDGPLLYKSIGVPSESRKRYHQRIGKSVIVREALASHFNDRQPALSILKLYFSAKSDEVVLCRCLGFKQNLFANLLLPVAA